jgi:hypothetical protein
VWEGLLLVGVCVITIFVIAAVRREALPNYTWTWVDFRMHTNIMTLLLGFCIMVYSAAIIYTSMRIMISFGTRMFLPMLPLYLLLLAMGGNWLTSHWRNSPRSALLVAGFLLTAVGYVGINARDLCVRLSPARYETLAKEYNKPASDGRPLLEWIESHISTADTIVAADGQATGYLLHRPTISISDALYSPVRWDCDEVKKQMERFNANFVFLYKPSPANSVDGLLPESQFVVESVVSQRPPCGFVIAAENSDVRILKYPALR